MNNFLKNKSDIIAWLEQYKVTNYKLIEDHKYGYVIDVDGNVYLGFKNLSSIPIKFGHVSGSFYCGYNKLISLEFSPKMIGGSFACGNNRLASLNHCPANIGGSFYCNNNKLASLQFCPTTVNGSFYCHNNKITNLIYFPDYIDGGIYLSKNNLTGMDIDRNGYYHFKEILSIRLEHKIAAEQELLENSIINKTPSIKIIKQSFKL